MSNGLSDDLYDAWDGYFDEDGVWHEYGDFDIFEEAVPDETDNFYKMSDDDDNGGLSSFFNMLGNKLYGLAFLYVVFATKPWK